MVGLGWVEEDVRRSESCGDEKVWSGGSWSGDKLRRKQLEQDRRLEVFGGVWRVNIWLVMKVVV